MVIFHLVEVEDHLSKTDYADTNGFQPEKVHLRTVLQHLTTRAKLMGLHYLRNAHLGLFDIFRYEKPTSAERGESLFKQTERFPV